MGRSPDFASTAADIDALFRLGFPEATALKALTAPSTVTRRIIMQKARRHTINVLRLLVSVWFQVLLTPLPGCFSSFARATFHYRSPVST
jgi:hypothetical protein